VTNSKCGDDIRVHGPGWDQPELILPSRYFFIQVPDGCNKQHYDVQLIPDAFQKNCQVKLQVLRQTLLSVIIVRYRILSLTCPDGFTISISNSSNGQVLAQKDIEFGVCSEECISRSQDFSHKMGCPSDLTFSRIHKDLR
jgi:hypothetical protein